MATQADVLAQLNAQYYNALCAGLNLSPAEFQLAQGDMVAPQTTPALWDLMNQVPNESVVQYYSGSTIDNFSGEYQSILSDLVIPQQTAFKDALGGSYADWIAEWKAYALANFKTITADIPSSLNEAQVKFFDVWASENLDPGTATQCANLLAAAYDNPVYIAQQLIQNLSEGAEVPFTTTQTAMMNQVGAGEARSFSMDSSTQSSDLSNSWADTSSSDGGTYFYTSSSTTDATDFTQTFSSAGVTVQTQFDKVATIQVQPLSTGTVKDGRTVYPAWYYGAALIAAYQDQTGSTWANPANWDKFFGPDGALQYVLTALIVVDGITITTTSDATYSQAEQTYANDQSNDDYGCWPFYVKREVSSTTQTNTTFDAEGHMTTVTTSPPGNPVVVGMLVSSVKSLAAG